MQSTIQSLNQVLDPVTNTTCQPSEVCGVATLTIKFDGKTGESKIGGCAHISNCSSTNGCQLAIANLLCGISSEECKVLYILNNQFFTCFILHCIKYAVSSNFLVCKCCGNAEYLQSIARFA